METIGEKIRTLRRKEGLSQEELAFRIGVSRQTISKWESDAMNPNMDSIRALCDIFDVKADFFFIEYPKSVITEENIKSEVAVTCKTDNATGRVSKAMVGCCLFSILFLLSMGWTIIIGLSALTSNKGDSVYRTPGIDLWGFCVFVGITIVLLIIDLLFIATICKRKRKCNVLGTECK